MMYIAFLAIFAVCCWWMYRQGRQLQEHKDALAERMKVQYDLSKHIQFLEGETKDFNQKVKDYEDYLQIIDPDGDWRLR